MLNYQPLVIESRFFQDLGSMTCIVPATERVAYLPCDWKAAGADLHMAILQFELSCSSYVHVVDRW